MARPQLLPLLLLSALAATAQAESSEDQLVLLGGLEEADVNDEVVQQVRDFAIKVYNQEKDDLYWSDVVKVVRARKQIVAGVNYFLDMEIGRTTCTKSQPNLADCPFHEQPHELKKMLCSFEVYTIPWQDTMSMTKYSCRDAWGSAGPADLP